jgi:hypothetical protein
MAGLIYTANFGGYDSPKAIMVKEDGVDYRFFSDKVALAPGWDFEWTTVVDGPLSMARYIKVMVPERLPGYDWFLWLDATMQIKKLIMPLVKHLLASPHDFAAFKHNEWACSYREIIACVDRKKDTTENLAKAEQLLKKQKLPANFGQAATGVLWRRNTDTVREHALAWWLDMQATTMRDQATFMLNLWSKKIYLEWIPGLHTKNKWFQYHRGHLK